MTGVFSNYTCIHSMLISGIFRMEKLTSRQNGYGMAASIRDVQSIEITVPVTEIRSEYISAGLRVRHSAIK